jgi:hypothetical protein
MTPTALHILAVNGDSDLRHTNLTRAQGLRPDLPALEDWLGVDAILTDQIEIFPIEDLGDMTLTDYVVMAFDPAPPPGPDARTRLDALEGSVLLVPDTAIPTDPKPGAMLTRIATLPLVQADHSADLPKADVRAAAPPAEPESPAAPPKKKGLSQGVKIAIFIAIFVALYIVLDRF